jgi:hypothetical protein
MTNGGSPAHGLKRTKKAPDKKGKEKGLKVSLKRKGWLPAGLAKEKNG